jgi:hypothetical protein
MPPEQKAVEPPPVEAEKPEEPTPPPTAPVKRTAPSLKKKPA